ncbi:replication protein A 32 kDa subunit-A [Venturia canescens]|uniref:replication protein A 32 kDa subunit-A n=1 Tax=Venturia canescens TaxID=32260 RepID=UPI001C9C6863|nr:replication protein A 32 kDa subunit-A [Venturia canescens]
MMWSEDKNTTKDGKEGVGGFMDSTYVGEPENNEKKIASIRISSIVPVMIKHIHQHPNGVPLWGKQISMLQFIAYVQNVERATTKISYDLVDETGKITAYQFLETSNTDNKGIMEVKVGSYARVIGCPREQNKTGHIFIMKIMPVFSMTEILAHLMEVTYMCLKSKEVFSRSSSSKSTIGRSSMMDDDTSLHGMNADQAHVFKIIKAENHSETGAVKQDLIKKLSPDLRNKLDGILEFLVGEGHIYTTCTDDHFKAT